MKNMTLGAFALASALALASTPGHALTFAFSFNCGFGASDCVGPMGFNTGPVTGLIDGLQDNLGVSPPPLNQATAVQITSAPDAFNLDLPVSVLPASLNNFGVSNGVILTANFSSSFPNSASPSEMVTLSFGGAQGAFISALSLPNPNPGSPVLLIRDTVSRPFSLVPGPIVGAGLPALYWQVVAFSPGGDGGRRLPKHLTH
jgi:hypothetical protein